jgi:hypothetical protein
MRSVALAGLLSVLAGNAMSYADVITINVSAYSGPNGGVPAGGVDYFYFNGGDNQLTIFNNYSLGLSGFSINLAANSGIAASGNLPLKFGAGQSIGSSSSYSRDLFVTTFKNFSRVSPDFGPNSFLGFKDSAGRYGYFEVTWTAATQSFRLLSGAYESTAGVAIRTPGGVTPVPEPSSVLFASVSVVGAAVKRYRRKRAKADFQSPTKSC